MRAAHVLADAGFATKPALALIRRATEADMPFAWVAAYNVYGVGDIEMALRQAGKGYVLGINANSQFNCWIGKPEVVRTAVETADDLDPTAWQLLSADAPRRCLMTSFCSG